MTYFFHIKWGYSLEFVYFLCFLVCKVVKWRENCHFLVISLLFAHHKSPKYGLWGKNFKNNPTYCFIMRKIFFSIISVLISGKEGAICTKDSSCADNLLCDSIRHQCRQRSSNDDSDFCKDVLCKEGEGDCDNNDQCDGTLICVRHSCPIGYKDCCTSQ